MNFEEATSLERRVSRYEQALSLLSQVAVVLHPYNRDTRDLLYDHLYLVECMIFTEMKKVEADLRRTDGEV